jgi:uncharacterized membrane protein
MYCRNCGKEVADQAVMCVACGVPPKAGKMFCQNCASETSTMAEICTKCGVRLASNEGAGLSSSSMDENVAATLSYLFGWITGLIFLLIDKRPFVKFHAAQSIALSIAMIPVSIAFWILRFILVKILSMIPVLGSLFIGILYAPLVWLAIVGLSIFAMYKAYNKEKYKIPIIGNIVEGMVK